MCPQESSRLRVLVVEDEFAARDATCRFLENFGHEVSVAHDPASAMQAAEELAPNVLVCDCHLENKFDGLETARRLQQQHGLAVILVSAYRFTDLQDSVGDLSVFEYLRKPISLRALAEAVVSAPSGLTATR